MALRGGSNIKPKGSRLLDAAQTMRSYFPQLRCGAGLVSELPTIRELVQGDSDLGAGLDIRMWHFNDRAFAWSPQFSSATHGLGQEWCCRIAISGAKGLLREHRDPS